MSLFYREMRLGELRRRQLLREMRSDHGPGEEIRDQGRGGPELDAAMHEVVERLGPIIQAEVANVLAKRRA